MEPDGEPESTCASNHQAKKQAGCNYLENTKHVLSVIAQMSDAKYD